jgi:AraC family transcriptional regulator
MKMEPRIIYKPAFTVVGFPLAGGELHRDRDSLWDQLASRYKEIPGADPDQGFGVHIFSEEGRNYIAGLAVMGDGRLPEGMAEQSLRSHAYAVFTHRGILRNLENTIREIFDTWLPHSGYRLADDFYFEYYDDHFQPDSADSLVFLFIPVINLAEG